MFRVSRSTVGIALGAVLVLGVTACSAGPVPAGPISSAPVQRVVAIDAAAQLLEDPLRAYGQSPDVVIAAQRATDILTDRCMVRFGYRGYTGEDIARVAASFVEDDGRLYGITDGTVAGRYGYLPKPAPVSSTPPEDWTADYRLVLSGLRPGDNPAAVSQTESPGTVDHRVVPAGGCLGAARKQITGDIQGQQQGAAAVGARLDSEAWSDAWADPETEKAKDDWSACMAKRGYRVHDPLEDHPVRSGTVEGKAPAAEIAQALADIRCKETTDFVARANAVRVRFAQRALEANRAALVASKAFNDHALSAAHTVIAGKG
jgi:hypothetical protein